MTTVRARPAHRSRVVPRVVTAAARLAAALVGTLAAGAGCHIFGLEPVPCSNDNEVQECGAGEVCADGVCVERPAPGGSCAVESVEDPSVLRRLRVGAATHRGFYAMDARAFGAEPDIAADLSCAPACAFVAQPVPRARAPLVGDVAAAGLEGPQLVLDGSVRDTAPPFALELIFRSPTVSGATLAGAYTRADDGWRVETIDGATRLRVGAAATVTLVEDGAGVWTHALCLVDTARLVAADAGGLLCSVDGEVRAPGAALDPPRPATAPVVLGEPGGNDGAVAFVRTWPHPPSSEFDGTATALAGLAEEGRRRLLQYVGVEVESAGRLLRANQPGDPRVVELPAREGSPRAVAWVGAGWPRLLEMMPTLGIDPALTVGIQLEPRSQSLLESLSAACAERLPGPTGRRDACALAGMAAPGSLALDATVERNTPFVLSMFFPASATDLQLVFEQEASDRSFTCTVLPGAGTPCADGFTAALIEDYGPWRRMIWATSLGFPLARVRFVSRDAAVWAPQLELGTVATSPIPFIRRSGVAASVREADTMLVDEAGLGVTQDLSLVATLVDLVGRATPVTVLDDEDEGSGVLQLQVERGDGPGGSGPAMGVTIDGRVDQRAISSAVFSDAASPVVAGHVGRTDAPLVSCAPCIETPVAVGDLMQAETVRIAGPHAVIEQVEVTSLGRDPRPTTLALHIDPLDVDACVDDGPLFTLQGCADGLCPTPAAPTRWDTPARGLPARVGPLPGGVGYAGRRTTDLFGADAFGTLLLEVRFQSPDEGRGGELASVRGPLGLGLRLDENTAGRYDIVAGVDGEEAVVAEVGPGEWNQLVCLFDEPVRCIVNLGDVVLLDGLRAFDTQDLVAATIGDASAGVFVSLARGSTVRGAPDGAEAEALIRRRAADRLGLRLAERRVAAALREVRATPTFVTMRLADGLRQLVRVGAGWPRIEAGEGGGTAAYVTGPGGLNTLAGVLDGIAAEASSRVAGPHAALVARVAPAGLHALGASATDGIVSVFVSPESPRAGARLWSGSDVVTLDGHDGHDGLDGAVHGDADAYHPALADGAGEDSTDARRAAPWTRLWLKVAADAAVFLELDGPTRVAAAQFEAQAVSPGAPAFDGVLSGDSLELLGPDLANAGSSVVTFAVDGPVLGGRFFSITRVVPGRTDIVSLSREADGIDVSTSRWTGLLGSPSVIRASFPGSAGLDRVHVWWRAGAIVLGRSDGTAQVQSAPTLDAAPNRLVVGEGQVRLRALEVSRGDLRARAAGP